MVTDIESFTQYFKTQNIRIKGTFHEPLFKLADIAKKTDDTQNYRTKTRDYGETLLISEEISKVKYLTEKGLYEYLITLTKPKAELFRQTLIAFIIANKKSKYNTITILIRWLMLLRDFQENILLENTTSMSSNEIALNNNLEENIQPFSYTADEISEATILTKEEVNNFTELLDNSVSYIYFIRLYATAALGVNKPVYKYGRTKDPKSRISTYIGHPASIEKIIKVPHRHVVQVENTIKILAKSENEYHKYINLHELISTADIGKYYDMLDGLLN